VPTGLQDYRPALYGALPPSNWGRARSAASALDVDPAELHSRLVLCYTGEPRNSGTNNWEITKRHLDGDAHIFDCFERIRDTAAEMRQALTAATGTRSRRASRVSGTTASGSRLVSPRPPSMR
jgi:D-glycero-alpha-D-manno-heptose-7-phosphate kinase